MKKNLPLIIGILLPIIFIIIISLVVFIPKASVKPQHNFIFSNENVDYYYAAYRNTYKVENERLEISPIIINNENNRNITYKGDNPPLYLYDVKNDSSHQITPEEAMKYVLDPGPSSPDGYTVNYSYGHNGIFELFGSDGNKNGFYIGRGNAQKRLAGLTQNYYGSNFKLIGWVK